MVAPVYLVQQKEESRAGNGDDIPGLLGRRGVPRLPEGRIKYIRAGSSLLPFSNATPD
jgi:hypothetical protein